MRKLALLCLLVSACPVLQAQNTNPVPAAESNAGTVAPPAAPAGEPVAPILDPSVAPGVPSATPNNITAAPQLVPNESSVNPNARTVRDFQGEDISMVLRLLARQAGINIVVSDAVAGTINMRVENLTPMEAIRVIADAKGLDLSQSNNVYFIKTAAEKAKEPTEAGFYTFSYAKVSDVKDLITSQIQSKIPVQIDLRTNSVFYREYRSNMACMALFFESLDRPTQQVMIEARLVEVNANPKQSYGINWSGVVGNAANGQTIRYAGTGLPEYTWENGVPLQSAFPLINLTGTNQSIVLNGRGKDLFDQITGQFAILSIPEMSATLRLLNEDADAEFLANPRVVTASNMRAQIKITRKQPIPKLKFNEQTASTTFDSFEEKEFGNTLEVTPTINKDNFVTMLVKPEISNKVADSVFTISNTTVTSPIIDTRSLESNVLIKSGDTLAIGGLLQDETSKARSKVPVLGDIPIIGYAFQERLNARAKRNLLVFITPTIIQQGYGTGLESQVSGLKNSGEEYADPNGWRNNARGSVRLVPTSHRQVVTDYPKPGKAPEPIKMKPVRRAAPSAGKPAIQEVSKPSSKAIAQPSPKPSPKATPQTVAQKNDPEFKITVPQREE